MVAAKEEAERVLKAVFCSLPDWGVVLPVMIAAGDDWEKILPDKCFLTPGVPIHPVRFCHFFHHFCHFFHHFCHF